MPASNEQSPRTGVRLCAVGLALASVCLASGVRAQRDDDVPLPPRIDRSEAPAGESSLGPQAAALLASPIVAIEAQSLPGHAPRAARLAPLPEDRGSTPDEIVVVGSAEWRLPDLGSWRAQERAEERKSRIRVTFLHLFDPDDVKRPEQNPFFLNNEQQRFGTIQVVRWRFGRKDKDKDEN